MTSQITTAARSTAPPRPTTAGAPAAQHKAHATASAAEQRGDALAERLFGSLIGGLELLTVELGHRLGLYTALHSGGPATSAQLAERAGITERYAREWLEQQAAAGLIDVVEDTGEAATRRFALPAAHVGVLVDADDPTYLIGAAQHAPRHRSSAARGGGGLPDRRRRRVRGVRRGDAPRHRRPEPADVRRRPARLGGHDARRRGAAALGWAGPRRRVRRRLVQPSRWPAPSRT